MGKVTEEDDLSTGQINEFKKALNKMYHSKATFWSSQGMNEPRFEV